MNALLRRLNLWTLERLSANTGWLAVPRSRRLTWAGLLIVEVAVTGVLAASVVARLGALAGWAVAGLIFAAFAAFVWQLASNPVRTLRLAPEVGLWVAGGAVLAALLAALLTA